MKEGQKDIFYMAADSLDAASSAPFVERLVQRDYEVYMPVLPLLLPVGAGLPWPPCAYWTGPCFPCCGCYAALHTAAEPSMA